MKHSIKVDLNCLEPGNVHLNNLNAPILNVLNFMLQNSTVMSTSPNNSR